MNTHSFRERVIETIARGLQVRKGLDSELWQQSNAEAEVAYDFEDKFSDGQPIPFAGESRDGRALLGWSEADLARKASFNDGRILTAQTVRDMESGDARKAPDMLDQLAIAEAFAFHGVVFIEGVPTRVAPKVRRGAGGLAEFMKRRSGN